MASGATAVPDAADIQILQVLHQIRRDGHRHGFAECGSYCSRPGPQPTRDIHGGVLMPANDNHRLGETTC